jgi:hypothetical protein
MINEPLAGRPPSSGAVIAAGQSMAADGGYAAGVVNS